MTYEEAHRKMWNDLADGEVKAKEEWFEQNNINHEKIPANHCFTCNVG